MINKLFGAVVGVVIGVAMMPVVMETYPPQLHCQQALIRY